MEPADFYNYIFSKAESAYLDSSVGQKIAFDFTKAPVEISLNTLKPGAPLFVGLQWPLEHISSLDKLQGVYKFLPLLRKYIGEEQFSKANFSNLSFFRLPEYVRVPEDDLAAGFALFREFLLYMRPSMLVFTGLAAYESFKKLAQAKGLAYEEIREISLQFINNPSFTGRINSVALKDTNVYCLPLTDSGIKEEQMRKLLRVAFDKYEETDSIPIETERIFEAGIDGGVETYYRFRRRQADFIYFKKSVSLQFHDNGSEHFQIRYFELDNWEECWHSFVSIAENMSSWLMAFPVFIHGEYVSFVQSAILSERQRSQSMNDGSTLSNWLDKLQEARYNTFR